MIKLLNRKYQFLMLIPRLRSILEVCIFQGICVSIKKITRPLKNEYFPETSKSGKHQKLTFSFK